VNSDVDFTPELAFFLQWADLPNPDLFYGRFHTVFINMNDENLFNYVLWQDILLGNAYSHGQFNNDEFIRYLKYVAM